MNNPIVPQEDQNLLGLLAHGKAEDLSKSKFEPDWMESDIGRKLMLAGMELAGQGKEVNAISVVSRAKLSVPGLIPEMITLFNNGFGAASVQDAVEHTFQNYAVRQAVQMSDEIRRLAKSEPQNINKWLGRMGMNMASIIQSGDSYDARPSHHASQPLPVVFTTSLITGMNDLLRGGYKTCLLLIYAGVTSHGKSLTLKSHVLDLILQKFRVAVIITENTASSFSAELAAAMAGVDFEKEVAPNKFEATAMQSASERKARYHQCLQYCDEYLMVYGPDYYSDQQLTRMQRFNHYDAIVIDYMMKKSGMLRKIVNPGDEVGDFADWLLAFVKDTGLFIASAGQMSKLAAKSFVKTGATDEVILYGTARVEYASDEFVPLRRHPKLKNTAQFRVKKDRLGNRLDTTHDVPLDAKRRILQIQRLLNQDLALDESLL